VKISLQTKLEAVRRAPWTRLLAAVLALAVVTSVFPGAAFAQDKRSRAKALLVEGGNLIQSGEYAEALTRFERAYALIPSPKIYFNYGLAYYGMDRPSEAIHYFEAFIAEAGDAPPANVNLAREYLNKASKRVTVVELTGDMDGAEVSIDGRSYKNASRVTVDAGVHQLTVDKAGRVPFLHRLTANPGERVVITVRFQDLPSDRQGPLIGPIPRNTSSGPLYGGVPPVATPVRDSSSDEQGRDSGPSPASAAAWQTTAGWVSAGVAVAFLAGGLTARLLANQKFADFNQTHIGPNNRMLDGEKTVCNKVLTPDSGSPTCQDLLSKGETYETLSWVGLIGGGILAATAVVFFATAPSASPSRAADTAFISCSPTLGPGLIGAGCGGRF
jgi:hypothetical protein